MNKYEPWDKIRNKKQIKQNLEANTLKFVFHLVGMFSKHYYNVCNLPSDENLRDFHCRQHSPLDERGD